MADTKIIIVEDENIDAMDIKETLESLNYEIPYVASNGIDAIKQILKIMPDLILIDIVLQGEMNGIELAYKIKDLGIPFIFLTGHSDEDIIKKAMKTDPYGYLIKPIDSSKLNFSIQHAIYKKEMELKTFKQISITRAINKVLQESFKSKSTYQVAQTCLEVAQDFTGSKIGFLGRVNRSGSFDIYAISDMGWADCVMPRSSALEQVMGMKLRGYWSKPIRTEKPVIVNDPESDPERLGAPEGHSEIRSFMGVPLKRGDETVGMIALANKNTGYNEDDQHAIETLSTAFMEALTRKKTELQLIKSEERFRSVTESAADGIVTSNADGEIKYCNPSLEKIFGYSPGELSGKHLTILMPERFRKNYAQASEKFKKSGKHELLGTTINSIGLRKDGTEFPIELALASWESGGKTYFTAIARDITEKEQAKEKVRVSQERLKMAVEIADIVYWEYDHKNDLIDFDEEFFTQFGTSAEGNGRKIIPSSELSGSFLSPEEHERVGIEINKAVESTDPNFSTFIPHTIERADGEKRNINMQIRAKLDDHGNKIGIRGINQDVTELKKVEEALAKSHRRMAHIIDFLPDATFGIDNKGRVIFWNNAIQEMTGVDSEEMIGKDLYETALPFYGFRRPVLVGLLKESDKTLNELYKDMERVGEVLTAKVDLIVNGEEKAFHIKAVPLYDPNGNFEGGIQIVLDVTEIKQYQQRIIRELEINQSLNKIYAPLVSPQSSIKDVGQVIIEEAKTLTESSFGLVAVFDSTNRKLIEESLAIILPEDYQGDFDLPLHVEEYDSMLINAIISKKSFINNSPIENIDFGKALKTLKTPKLKNVLVVPVVLGEELVGVIALSNSPNEYTEDDLDVVERLAVFYSLAIQNKNAEEEIQQSLNDKNILLREIHHRVKNNMQIISSLMNLQMNHVKDENSINVLKDSKGRIKSMAMVYEKLYQSPDLTEIDLEDYVETLVNNILFSYLTSTDNITSHIEVENIQIGLDTAIPCGLIINELVTNSVKHAFPDRNGSIKVKITSHGEDIHLLISDDGIGLPENMDLEKLESLGFNLVKNLVEQIDGKMTVESNEGTSVKIIFKELKYKERI